MKIKVLLSTVMIIGFVTSTGFNQEIQAAVLQPLSSAASQGSFIHVKKHDKKHSSKHGHGHGHDHGYTHHHHYHDHGHHHHGHHHHHYDHGNYDYGHRHYYDHGYQAPRKGVHINF